VVAIDNIACGPAVGGVRMAPDVSAEEAFRLARAMTLKNAAAGLPHGGGKSVIVADPKMPARDKERLMRSFAAAIADLSDYIPGPDMGTDELAMGWIKDETGRAVGLPRELGGIPLDEIGATGFGLAAAVEVAADHIGMPLRGARSVIQGFGAVGKHAARFLAQKGVVLVGASDTQGTVADDSGLDIAALIALKAEGRPLRDHASGRKLGGDAVIDIPCDIWIPAARPDVIHADNVARLRAKMVPEGANIPCTEEAEAALAAHGVLVLPDFIANAGDVICAAVEYRGGGEADAFAAIGEKIRGNIGAGPGRQGQPAKGGRAGPCESADRARHVGATLGPLTILPCHHGRTRMSKDFVQIANDVVTGAGLLRQGAPDAMTAFAALSKAATTANALDTKTKELMAAAIGIAMRCEGCIAYHTKMAHRHGASRQELLETVALAVYMGGGPASVYGADAVRAYDQFSGKSAGPQT
jgi:glutamate dehydrogenase (NAD(P)+)